MSYINSINNSIVIVNISCANEEQAIESLRNSSAWCDEIHTFVAKKYIPNMIELFTYLKNKSFTEGIFPRELKFASIVPILNAGDLTQITE